MAATWLPFCIKRLGPSWKQGYPSVPLRTLAEIEGEVDHSMEGYRGGAYAVLDGPRQASWTFSIYRSGPPEQHYPLESIPWHAGLPGDRRQDTSLIGNLTLVGKEHEGVREDLTASQLDWSLKITQAIRNLAPRVKANPPTLRVNLWEHNWLSATSCPSGRIPWQAFLNMEDDMALTDGDKRWLISWREGLLGETLKQMIQVRNDGLKIAEDRDNRRLKTILAAIAAFPGGGSRTEAQWVVLIRKALKASKPRLDS